MGSWKVSHSGGRSEALSVAGILVVLALLWLPLVYHLMQKQQDELAQARRDVTNISAALGEQVSRLIIGVDQIARLMQEDFQRDPASFDLSKWVARSTSLGDVAKSINLFNERGLLMASSLPLRSTSGPVSILDRQEFQELASRAGKDFVIGRIYKGRVSPGLVMPILRRLADSSGRFRGVLSISLDPDYLARQFASLDVGQDGSLALFGLDGFLRARAPFVQGMYDHTVLDLQSRAQALAELGRVPAATYRLESAFDRRVRIFSYRAVKGLPLFLTVGRSEAEVLAPFRREAIRIVCFGIAATIAIFVLFVVSVRETRRRTARERSLTEANIALAEAEASFRGLFESSPDALYVHRVETDGSVTVDRFNQAAVVSLGMKPPVAGQLLSEILSPCVFADAMRAIGQVVTTGEMLMLRGDKSPDGPDHEIVIVPLSVNRRVDRIFVSVRNIGHLRQAEIAISQSEARYRLLAETTSDIITRLNLDFSRSYVSPSCMTVLGYEPAEMIGKMPSSTMHPEDADRVHALAKRLIDGEVEGERLTTTYRTKHKLGHWVWLEAGISLGRDEDGRPDALICALRDITERQRAEAAIKASEERFRLLAENTGELIILGDGEGRRSYISPASNRLLGFTPEELDVKMRSGKWLSPADSETLAGATLDVGGEGSFLCRVQHADASWIWIEAIVRRIDQAGDGEPKVVATLRDVSERYARADALRQAKEAAEQASQAKSDFLATMSHEIRTPLNGILGFAELLLARRDLSGEARRHLDRIQNAGSALRTVVDDILDFSKLEAGEVSLDIAPFRPSVLVDNATSITRKLAHDKGIDLIVTLDSIVPTALMGDHDRLRQILLNLLNNAIKFTREGSVTLSVRCARPSQGTVRVRISVTDTGIGIADDKRSRLFQRFSQVDGSISREFGGTGLGLAICRRLVEAMNGSIGVDSVVGRGSEFWFQVDLPIAEALPAPVMTEDDAAVFVTPASILLAEDQALNRDLARAILEAAGHHVDVVGNGAAAVAAVSGKHYDLVLMDVQMPVMDGMEATRCIRALPGGKGAVPIIAMTANVLPTQVETFFRAGMDDHLGKPFKSAELLTMIANRQRGPLVAHEPSQKVLAAFDTAIFADVAAAIGEMQAKHLLSRALAQVASLLDGACDAMDPEALKGGAHAAVSAVGTLGLSELAETLRALELNCCADDHIGPSIAAVMSALDRAATVTRCSDRSDVAAVNLLHNGGR